MKIIEYVNEINKIIKKSSHVYIMGHKYLDLDALASSIGMCEYIKNFGINSSIIINDKILELGVMRAIDETDNQYNFINSLGLKNIVKSDDLLIITDTNKKELLQDSELLECFDNVILIDHHDMTDKTIKKGLVIIDENSSSASEMVSELLENKKEPIPEIAANLLLSGITLDTTNFVLNTTCNTFKMCYYLTTNGANTNFVLYLLKEDINKYFKRQSILGNVTLYDNSVIARPKINQIYRREDLARVANTLIRFNQIEMSFALGKLGKDIVGISARSIGNKSVGNILEKLGGGGTEHHAGACIQGETINRVKSKILKIIKK